MSKICYFTFKGSLQDFLIDQQGENVGYEFLGNPAIKDAIEAHGVPHVEIGSILVNGDAVDFHYQIQMDDQVVVHPLILPIAEDIDAAFVVDAHLGKLAKDLRVLGFDSLYDRLYTEEKIVDIAISENRTVLSRSIGLLKNNKILHGYWLRSQEPLIQVQEVIKHFKLQNKIRPFTRCRLCNGSINGVSKESVQEQLLEKTSKNFDEFFQCDKCLQVYWKGSHYEKMMLFVEKLKNL